MKKRTIYIILIAALIVGFFFIVLEKKPLVPDNETAQGDGDKEQPEEDEPEEEQIEEIPEDKPDEDMPEEEGPQDDMDTEETEQAIPSDIPVVGQALPDFTLKNLKGEDVTLSKIEDKIILINFWATWCQYCREEMPDLQKLKEENDDIVVLAVNVDETKKQAEDYINDGGYDFEVLLDEEGKIAAQYLVTGMPSSYFVDKEGKYVGRVPGMITYEQMNEVLGNIREQ